MQTLLKKVRTVEKEAAELIDEARTHGQRQLQEITQREDQVITTLRSTAEKKAEEIIQEHLHKVGTEINSIKQESEQAVAMVHTSGKHNRTQAVARARKLFEDTYLSA